MNSGLMESVQHMRIGLCLRIVFVVPLLFLLVGAIPARAQRLLLKDYTTADGLPDSRVAPIIQDSKGYLWFGTQAGLTRYDGKEFVNFTTAKDVPGIFGRDIFEDHAGAIWFAYTGFAQGGLLRLWNGMTTDFSNATGLLARGPLTAAEDLNYDIWVGSEMGLDRIRFTDSARMQWTVENFPDYSTYGLFVDSKGNLWVAADSGRLYSYNHGGFDLVADDLYWTVRNHAMYESRDGSIWFGGIFGIITIDGDNHQRFTTADGLPPWGVWSFCEDRAGNFWVGTAAGLYRRKLINGRMKFEKEASFGDAIVYDICLDAEGNVWFASDPGARRLLESDLVLDFPGEDILSTPGFGPIAQGFDGTLYFGSRNLGLFAMKGAAIRSGSDTKPHTSSTFLSIFPELPQRTWYGMKVVGLLLEDGPNSREFREYPVTLSTSIHCIARSDAGEIILGSDRGLKRPGGGDSIIAMHHADLDSLVVFDMVRFGSNPVEYWLATNKGVRVVHLEGHTVRRVRKVAESRLQGTIVYTILADKQQRLWFGTDGEGLLLYDGTSFTQYKRADGLVGDRVYALAQDSLGLIWTGTSSGLSQFDGSSFRNFTYDQGFGEIGLHGLMTDRDGNLWVSSFPGISKLRPQRFYKSKRSPPVYILEMQVDTLHFREGTAIELDPDPAVITVRYAGLSFTDETNVRYKYMLEGFDKDWSTPVTQREVRYTHLGSGSYTFRVIARSADGVWSQRPATISFSILPPVWARWWFILGALALLSSSVYGLYRYRLEKALQVERTRSRIAMDLHDDIGSSLTRISVLSEVARRQAEGDTRGHVDTLVRIGDIAREIIDSLGDIVWSVDPKYDDLQNVIRRIVGFGQEVCEGRAITFETHIEATFDQTRLSLEQRRDVYLVFKEAINNVVRHSKAKRVLFSAREMNSTAILELVDDGVGYVLDTSGDGSGHGLTSMQERASRAGVVLKTESTRGEGTRTIMEIKTA
jgi:signal transduction histidine kinase/ligand-binding sensor domain-containing protein